jgi:hypothetical protein
MLHQPQLSNFKDTLFPTPLGGAQKADKVTFIGFFNAYIALADVFIQ